MDVGITVEGLSETMEMLSAAPKHIVVAGFAKALKAGADVIAAELAARTPERDEGDRNEEVGHLMDNIVIQVQVDPNGQGGIASVGFGKLGHIAMWVEYGHRLLGHKPNKKEIGTVQPHPFMRPAAAASSDAAVAAFSSSLEATVNAEYGRKVA